MKIENRKAFYDYFVEEKYEYGISLKGNEVKSIREGKCSIKEAWCTIQNGQLVLRGMHINKWETANSFDVNEDRERVLLAHRSEIRSLVNTLKVKGSGYTLIPLSVYFVRGKVKVCVGLCKGKHNYDKRESIKERQITRALNKGTYF